MNKSYNTMHTVEHYAAVKRKEDKLWSSGTCNDVQHIQLNLKLKVYKSIVSYSSWKRL